MSSHRKSNPGGEFSRLRDQFERLARDFAAEPLRAVVTFQPRDERSPDELEEDAEFRPVSVWLKSPANEAATAALRMIAEEVEAALGVVGERVGPGRDPAERWLLRVAHGRPWKHPLRHGPWVLAATWNEAEEMTTVEIDDIFRASALAIERIADGGQNVREKAAELEDRAIALLRKHRNDDDWTASRIAKEIGKPCSFLSRSKRFQDERLRMKGESRPKTLPACRHCRGDAEPFRCRKCDPVCGKLVRGCCAACHAELVHKIVAPE